MKSNQRGHIGSCGPGSDEDFDIADFVIDVFLIAAIAAIAYVLWSAVHG